MMLFSLFRPALFLLDAEAAHLASLAALPVLAPSRKPDLPASLASEVAGLRFASPLGIAPGYDKNAVAPDALLRLGFGFAEIGTVTPLPQQGNPKPRLFRLVEDAAVINRMGFNNDGMALVHQRLARRARTGGIVGVNVGANKDAVDRIADYVAGVTAMRDVADYLTINISSPNTPGLRGLQEGAALAELLSAVQQARGEGDPPIFLKVAPDLQPAEIDAICRLAIAHRLDGLIVSNTTISRPALRSKHGGEAGGLSGAPLRDLAQQRLADFRKASGGAITLIGVGGIASAADAFARIRAGASLVQLYSAMVYAGPGLPMQINRDLAALLAREGISKISDAIGMDVR